MRTEIMINGLEFYTKEEYKLPLLFKCNDNIVDLDATIEEVLLIEDDTGTTVLEWMEENGLTIIDEEFILTEDEDEYYRTDEDNYILKDECEEITSLDYYEYGNPQTGTIFYKLENERFALQSEDDNMLYIWDNKEEMLLKNYPRIEAYNNGDDEIKEIIFGEELEEIIDIVQDERTPENTFEIIARFEMEEQNPAYEFDFIGITKEDEIVCYSINNCNVCIYDYPKGFSFTLEELKDMILKVKNDEPNEYSNNIEFPLPLSESKEIIEFIEENLVKF